jgi:hypothetical protein
MRSWLYTGEEGEDKNGGVSGHHRPGLLRYRRRRYPTVVAQAAQPAVSPTAESAELIPAGRISIANPALLLAYGCTAGFQACRIADFQVGRVHSYRTGLQPKLSNRPPKYGPQAGSLRYGTVPYPAVVAQIPVGIADCKSSSNVKHICKERFSFL